MDDTDVRPQISIIIPTLNEEYYIERTLRCLRDQRFSKPYEIIVADGGSHDQTREIAEKYAKVIDNPGVTTAAGRNVGAKTARSSYLIFIDADTLVNADFLNAVYPIFEQGSYVGFSGAFRFDIQKPIIKVLEICLHAYFVFLDMIKRTQLPGYCFCVHADVFWAAGGFPDVFIEDYHLSMILKRYGRLRYFTRFGVLVSARRIVKMGFWRTLHYYIHKERITRKKESFKRRYQEASGE